VSRTRAGALALLALAATARAQARNEREATVGMRARIDQVVLPGPELVAKPAPRGAPIVLRVLGTWPHGTDFRYDLEYCGYEPGRHDLAAWLARADGAPAAGLPELAVEIRPLLPPGQVEPHPLATRDPPSLGRYTRWVIAAAVLWVAGLVAILRVGRRRPAAAAAGAAPATLADHLRPMVEAAARGSLDDAGKARLERLLLAFWRRRLDLEGVPAAAALARMREHPEAGALLRRLEAWLHHPPAAREEIDVAALLEPYRSAAPDQAEEARA
jgi:hypothetical protein